MTLQIVPADYGRRVKHWAQHGFKELGDQGGCGLGATTHHVLSSPVFNDDPHSVSLYIATNV